MSSSALRQRSIFLPKLLCNLSLVRSMGGGPRTFPGGLNKWQYKRMHEKLARGKERRLLQEEKQVYQARLRSEIRAKVAGKSPSACLSSAGGLSSKDHIKALADRFMKEGAEDLWNDDDGPIRSQSSSRSFNVRPQRPLDHRKILSEKGASAALFEQCRHYSRRIWNSSSDDSDEDEGFDSSARLEGGLLKKFQGNGGRKVNNLKFPRFSLDNDDSEKDFGQKDREDDRKRMVSEAALRNYDVKMSKRRLRRPVIEESDLSRDIQEIRQDIMNRKSAENHLKCMEVNEGSILTQKR